MIPHTPHEFDLLIIAGAVHTLESRPVPPTAVGIRDGLISWVGQAEDADPRSARRTLDCPSSCVVPGLVDAHIHPILGLELARGQDLTAVRTHDDLRSALRAAATSDPRDGWHLGWGLDPAFAGGRNPCATDIDAVVSDRPVLLRLFDAHSAVVNTRALEMSGITGREVFASASEVEVDALGRPTGFLKEWEAIAAMTAHVPPASFDERKKGVHDVLTMMAEAGLTGGQMLDYSDGMIELLEALEHEGELPIRLQISPWIMPSDSDCHLQEVINLQGRSGRRWLVDGVKLMIDGTIDNGTAWLHSPDVNGQSTGPLWMDPQEYTRVLHRLDAAGIRTTTHAIGDAGVDHVLSSIASLPKRSDGAGSEDWLPRHRVEHIETVPDATIKRFAELRVAASMQPTHCTMYCSGDGSDNWSRRLGPERSGNAWRLGSLRRAGVPLAVGSDWPVAPCDPLRIIADGQLRREAGQQDQTPVVPGESLTALELLEGFTTQRALSWGDPDGGRIRVGNVADLTILGGDPLTIAPDDLPDVAVLGTVVGGSLRWAGEVE